MSSNNCFNDLSGARMTATLFGALAGVGGLVHGIGEVLQGNVAPEGLIINSWTVGPIATNMGGEPGMTIVPNLQITGLLNILVSTAVLIWSVAFISRKNGGRILMLLSLAMLLVGGGFGPPLIGLLAGLAGTRINRPLNGWRRWVSLKSRGLAVLLFPWVIGIAALCGTFLVIGSLILVFIFGFNNATLFLNTFYLTVLSLIVTVFLAPFYDARESGQEVAA